MSRPKGSKNDQMAAAPDSIGYTTEQRLEFIANLIVECIVADQANGKKLLLKLGGKDDGAT